MTAEEWRPVPGWPDYDASSLGRIRSRRRRNMRLLKPSPSVGRRYPSVGIRRPGAQAKSLTVNVHALVAEAFYGPRPEGLEVRHLNGDKSDNRLANLQYATHSENLRDKARHGTCPNARKTHCPQGHPYDAVNTFYVRSGGRRCHACNRANVRRCNAARRAAQAA